MGIANGDGDWASCRSVVWARFIERQGGTAHSCGDAVDGNEVSEVVTSPGRNQLVFGRCGPREGPEVVPERCRSV